MKTFIQYLDTQLTEEILDDCQLDEFIHSMFVPRNKPTLTPKQATRGKRIKKVEKGLNRKNLVSRGLRRPDRYNVYDRQDQNSIRRQVHDADVYPGKKKKKTDFVSHRSKHELDSTGKPTRYSPYWEQNPDKPRISPAPGWNTSDAMKGEHYADMPKMKRPIARKTDGSLP